MPRKHHQSHAIKPSSTAHPSLSSTADKTPSAESRERTQPRSVNDLINSSRQNQTRQSPEAARKMSALVTAKTVHPSVKAILDIPDVLAPKPRPGSQSRIQRMASPSVDPFLATGRLVSEDETPKDACDTPSRNREENSLPGGRIIRAGSLLDLVLKSISTNWEWQYRYNQHFLSELPPGLKELMLDYVARYGPWKGLQRYGFFTLFPDIESPVNVQATSMSRLNLSGAISGSVVIDFDAVRIKDIFPDKDEKSSLQMRYWEFPAADWEFGSDSDLLGMNPKSGYFANLTHLSLGRPQGVIEWTDLLRVGPNLAPITHLSLAYWPMPSYSSRFAIRGRSGVNTANLYLESHLFTGRPSQKNIGEICAILSRLSKATYCLRWLDLTGCRDWIDALAYSSHDRTGPQWDGGWRQLEEIVVKEGSRLPKPTNWEDSPSHLCLYDRKAEEHKRAKQKQEWLAIHKTHFILATYSHLATKLHAAIIKIKDSLSEGARKRITLTTDYPDNQALRNAAFDNFYAGHFSKHFTRELYMLYSCLLKGYGPPTSQRVDIVQLWGSTKPQFWTKRTEEDMENAYAFISRHTARIDASFAENQLQRSSALYVSPGNWPLV